MMELDLRRIIGVQDARIQVEDGTISEVHVVADSTRRPKMIVRDAVTMLFARHGVRVGHQKVSVAGSVAGSRGDADAAAGGDPAWRIRFSSVQVTREGETVRASVVLSDGDRDAEGTADALATRSNQIRVVAEATLGAIRRLTSGLVPLYLEDAVRCDLGRLPVVLAHVVLLRQGGECSLVGSCPADEGRLEAAAGAVLDAVNRILPPYRSREEEVEYAVGEDSIE